jgi:hypothetical protein
MIEQSTIEALVAGIGSGEAIVIVGAVLLVLVALARRLVAVRQDIPAQAASIVSASAAVVAGVAVALLAGADPLGAVLLGVLATPASSGLWDLVLGLGQR